MAPSTHGWSAYCNGVDDKKIFAEEARDHVARLRAAVPLSGTDRVLDFGCGFGYVGELLASLVEEVGLWDTAPRMLRLAAERSAHLPNVTVVDLADGRPLPRGHYDLVLVTSVIQYMLPEELAGWPERWGAMLRPGGRIVVSDVPPPDVSGLAELVNMLVFASRRGILGHAVRDGVREFGRYVRVRRVNDLLRRTPADLAALAAGAGLSAERLPVNLTHRAGRFSMVLRPV